MDAAPSAGPEPRGVNIVIYSVAQGVSSIGSWMQRAGMGWLTWELTHSPAWVGALALTEVVSALWVSPLAGALTDRQSPFRVLMVTQALMMLQALAMFAYVFAGHPTIWGVLALALADSTFAAFNAPARLTVMNYIAPPGRLSQAIASNSMFFNLARVIGPAIGGAIMATGHTAPVFGLNALSYIAFIATVLYLRPWIDRRAGGDIAKGRIAGDIAEGFGYIARTPHIATLFMLAACFSLLARPFNELLPAINGALFHAGPTGLSAMMSAQGAGAFVGAALMLRRRGVRRVLVIAFGGGIALPLTIAVVAMAPNLAWALPVMAVAGLAHVVCNIAMQSLAQTFAAEGYRGRVMSIYGLMFRSFPSAGAFLIGLAAQAFGLRVLLAGTVLLGAALTAALALHARRIYGAAIEPA
jgi:MFS family permease